MPQRREARGAPVRGFSGGRALTPDSHRTAAQAHAPKQATADTDRPDLLDLVLSSLDDDQASDIVALDLSGKAAFADAMVVASGRSQRHVGAVAEHLIRRLKEAGYGKARIEGMPACDWVLVDAGDIVVHIFRPEVRAFYNLEKLWSVDVAEPVTGNGRALAS